jgi:hypothetical protein
MAPQGTDDAMRTMTLLSYDMDLPSAYVKLDDH